MRKKRIFIGSSSEELDLANAAKAILEFEKNFDDRKYVIMEVEFVKSIWKKYLIHILLPNTKHKEQV